MKLRKVTTFLFLFFLFQWVQSQLDYEYLDQQEDGIEIIDEKSDGEYQRELERNIIKHGATKPLKNGKVRVDYIPAHLSYFSLDEKQQMFYASYTICLAWTDERMKWDPRKYNGISYVSVGPSDIWRPKLFVVGSGSGAWDITDYRPDRIKIRQYGELQILSCPTYYVKVGCALDLSNYPNDEHGCYFVLQSTEIDVELGSPLLVPGIDEMFAITINENKVLNRTSTGSFSLSNMVALTQRDPDAHDTILMAFTLKRNAPFYYYATVTLPSLIFALLNICGSLIIEKSYAASVFLINILFIAVFMQDMIQVLPLHYETLPHQVIFWSLHLLLAIIGFVYVLIKEITRRRNNDVIIIYKLPERLDDWTKSYVVRQIFSMPCIFIVTTLFSLILFFF
ncbi:unnamed protein product [Auanema sp. JU1783]|nr:unnamed protein product [Auanema sp. JU1783]